VVTGGASAVYGSERDQRRRQLRHGHQVQRSVKVNVEGGIANHGGRRNRGRGSGLRAFVPRHTAVHFEASYEFHNDPGILRRSDRPWGRDVWTVQGGGTAANPYHLVENTRISNTSFGGLVGAKASSSNPLGGMNFATDGVASPFVNGTATGTNGFQSGGEWRLLRRLHKEPARKPSVIRSRRLRLHGYAERLCSSLGYNQSHSELRSIQPDFQ